MRTEFREEPCRAALNRVQGMPFSWSLNAYMGCAHRCTFEAHGIADRRVRPIEPESRPAQLVLFP